MTRKALGRGLSALLPEAQSGLDEELYNIDIDLIDPNPSQPRNNFDEARLEELAQSIRENGIVQPLLVRRDGTRYQLVAGERRWRAAQRASLLKVPAVVREIPENKLLELALIENIQRQELNAIEEALAYKRLIETIGFTQEILAQRVGRDRTFITNYLRLLRLPTDLQDLVERGALSVGHARTLLAIEDVEMQRRIALNIVEKSLSVRETEKMVKQIIKGASPGTSTTRVAAKRNDANVKAAETRLRRRLGTQVRVIGNSTGGGKIEIEYYSDKDLDRIYQIILSWQSRNQKGFSLPDASQ
ncbi:MAG: ParB/RepB/Spo0J family partition protein [Pyrinomonadaceae bacterium]